MTGHPVPEAHDMNSSAVDIVADRLSAFDPSRGDSRARAVRIVSALIDAGRLLPSGGTARTIWRAYNPNGGGHFAAHDRARIEAHIANTAHNNELTILQSAREITWPDGSRYVGPWVDAVPS